MQWTDGLMDRWKVALIDGWVKVDQLPVTVSATGIERLLSVQQKTNSGACTGTSFLFFRGVEQNPNFDGPAFF